MISGLGSYVFSMYNSKDSSKLDNYLDLNITYLTF
jgi:hypothetical protein